MLGLAVLAGGFLGAAQETQKVTAAAEIRSVEVDEPGWQILSFRHLADSTVVQMRGTRIEPAASIKMKVESRPVSINVTTPIQTFWLLVTAEPDFAVNDPSPVAVLYSTGQADSQSRALHVEGKLLYYTYYTQYSTTPAVVDRVAPNEFPQARKAIELASKAGILGLSTPEGEDPWPIPLG